MRRNNILDSGTMCSKVLIVGGSNSIKYTPYVLDYLTGKALVERVPDNARSTRYTLERLDGWLGSGQWDVIHFNWGMHDLTRVDGASPQVPLREYEDNLHRLAGRLARVGEQLVWASTMSMLPRRQPKRRLEDIRAYNRVAEGVMALHHVPVHDLFGLTSERPDLFGDDGIHFTDEGYRVLGKAIGSEIADLLM